MTKKINRNRSNQLAVRLSDSELALFNKKQAASGLNRTDFLVSMLKNTKITAYCFNDSLKVLYSKIRKIGVNLNQIAYLVNIGRHYEAESEIMLMKKEYHEVIEKLNSFLDNPLVNAEVIEN